MPSQTSTTASALRQTAVLQTAVRQTAETLDALSSVWRRLIPPEGVSMTAASTLALLLRSGPLRLSALAEREAVTQPAMTGLIGRLEATGLVRRCADPSDGRAVLVELTAQGSALIRSRRTRRAAVLTELLGLLDAAERAQVDAAVPALQRLVDHAVAHKNPVPNGKESR